jgi:SAM-dependent methyltransferase
VGRAAIYLDALRPNGGSGFYRELCNALLPGPGEAPGDVLDIGCGLGNLAFELGRRLPGHIVGLDIDPQLLRWAERVAAGGEIEIPVRESAGRFRTGRLCLPGIEPPGALRLVAGNLVNPPFADSSFGLVALVNVLDQVSNPARALRRAVAMVRDGGYLLFAQPDSWNAGTTPPERWLAQDDTEWDAVFERVGLETVGRVDDLEWVLVDAPRLRHVFRVHGRLLRKGR